MHILRRIVRPNPRKIRMSSMRRGAGACQPLSSSTDDTDYADDSARRYTAFRPTAPSAASATNISASPICHSRCRSSCSRAAVRAAVVWTPWSRAIDAVNSSTVVRAGFDSLISTLTDTGMRFAGFAGCTNMNAWDGRDVAGHVRQREGGCGFPSLSQIAGGFHHPGHERRIEWKAVPPVVEVGRDHEQPATADWLLSKCGGASGEPGQHVALGLLGQPSIPLDRHVAQRPPVGLRNGRKIGWRPSTATRVTVRSVVSTRSGITSIPIPPRYRRAS